MSEDNNKGMIDMVSREAARYSAQEVPKVYYEYRRKASGETPCR